MKPEALALSKYRFEQAQRSKRDAELLFKDGSFASSVNRVYYSVFYAVKSLLALKQIDSSKHSGVISLFNREFVKTGLMSKASSGILTEAFELRITGDYDDFVDFTKERVEILLKQADTFLSETEKALAKLIQT